MCVMPEAQVDQAHPSRPTSKRSRAIDFVCLKNVSMNEYVGVRIRNTFDFYWLFMFLTFSDNKVRSKNYFRLYVRYSTADNLFILIHLLI
jgi:hypothetical protein